jgi:hypothetical protein
MSNKLSKSDPSSDKGNSLPSNLKSINSVFDVAKMLMDLNLLPKTRNPLTVAQVATAIEVGNTVGMSPIISVNSIEFIEGNVTWKTKVIPGLLSQKGIAIQVIQDYEPEYLEKNVPILDENKNPKTDQEGRVLFYKNEDGSYIKNKTEIDRVTTVRFIREFPGLGFVQNEISYRLSDAKSADLYPKKDNWLKLTRQMMMARCISRGARLFASDVVAGLYDNTEMAELNNDYDITGNDEDIIVSYNPKSKSSDSPAANGKKITVDLKEEYFNEVNNSNSNLA